MSDPIQEITGRGTSVPAGLHPPSAGMNQKPDSINGCRTEVAESLMRRILGQIWTEDVMRLYVDSFLPEGQRGRPFPTAFGGHATAGWERTFPRCWLRDHRAEIERELQTRFRAAERDGRFADKLHWYAQFIDNPTLTDSAQIRTSLRRVLEEALSENGLRQTGRDWVREVIERFRQGLVRLDEQERQYLQQESSLIPLALDNFAAYASALTIYARVALNLSEGGGGMQHVQIINASNRHAYGASTARQVFSTLEESHRTVIRSSVGDLRNALRSEVRRYIIRLRRENGLRWSDSEINSLVGTI